MNIIHLPNILKRATGTIIGLKNCLDVNVSNTSAIPVSVNSSTLTVLETRVHDAASANINASSGAWIALGSGSAIANTIYKIQISSTVGQALEIGTGASAGAAVRKFVMNKGEGPLIFDLSLVSGNKLWVRSLESVGSTVNLLTLNLIG